MRDYGKVFSSFWTSEDMRDLTEDGRTLALYLMTSPHGNMLGCFRLPNAYVGDDLQWEFARVSGGFAELSGKGFATRCERSFWVVIHKHLKWNKLDNENVGKAAAKLLDQLTPSEPVKAALVAGLREFGKNFPSSKLDEIETVLGGYRNGIETLSKPVAVTVAVTVAETVAGSSDPAGSVVPSDAGDATPGTGKAKRYPDCPHQAIIALYHEILPVCPRIREWTPTRAAKLRARWNEDQKRQNLDYWRAFFEYVAKCDFLIGKTGGGKPFFAGLVWMTEIENFTKIREKHYENRGPAAPAKKDWE